MKKLLLILLLSVLVVIGMTYAELFVHYLLAAHEWVAETLKMIFTGGQAGEICRQLIALLFVPFAVAFIPGILYWMLKRKWLPCFMDIVWVIWLLQTTAVVAVARVVTAV